jgi:hypothetical protein
LTDPKVTKDRKEEKESHKLRQEVLVLKQLLKDATEKHNQILDVLAKTGLNIQIICTQNKFVASKA